MSWSRRPVSAAGWSSCSAWLSHRDAASLGPEGYPIDWHGVRAFYRVAVDSPAPPTVGDVGGSTSEARWFGPDELAALPPELLTEVTADVVRATFGGRRPAS